MRKISFASILLLSLALSSCQLFQKEEPSWKMKKKWYKKADPAKTSVKISVFDQKAWLLDGSGRVILKTDVSTGVPGHETPTGNLRVLEKLEGKRSNRYGKYVDAETGKVLVEKTWLHKGPKPKGSVYQGIAMPYWMRLTWWGVGMHVGKFPKRTRCSFGCVRVFEKAQPFIYAKTQVGTPVEIRQESIATEMAKKEKFSWLD